jgi:DNA-binding CsgD family transcriptional regulator
MPRAKVLDANPYGLSYRECEVLEELIRLGSPKAVAASEGLDPKTVRNVMRSAVKRMKAKTPLQAAVMFDRELRRGATYAGRQSPVRSVFDLGNDNSRSAAA